MRAVTQSGRRSTLGRNGSSAQCRLLAKSGHFGPRLLPGGTLSTRSSALPPDPKRRLPGEAAIERPTNSPTPERQAFPQAAWSHAQGVEEGTWIGLASRAWRSRPRTTLDRPHPQAALPRSDADQVDGAPREHNPHRDRGPENGLSWLRPIALNAPRLRRRVRGTFISSRCYSAAWAAGEVKRLVVSCMRMKSRTLGRICSRQRRPLKMP
jgi:hypothetical protein